MTTGATTAQPAPAGFKVIIGDQQSQSYLQDVAVLGGPGDGVAVKGVAKGPKRLEWSFDGQTEITVACIFEGGVTLTRAVGKPKTCAATIQRSKGPGAASDPSWGMDSAAFTCR